MIKKISSAGLTLVEMIVVMGLTTMLMTVIVSLTLQSYRTYEITTKKNDLQYNARLVVDNIKGDAQKAVAVLGTYDIYTTSTSVLILKLVRLDANQNPIEGTNDYVIYRRKPSSLTQIERIFMIDAVSTTHLFSPKTSNLAFEYQDSIGNSVGVNYAAATRVKITLTAQDVVRGKTYTTSYSTLATLRNYQSYSPPPPQATSDANPKTISDYHANSHTYDKSITKSTRLTLINCINLMV